MVERVTGPRKEVVVVEMVLGMVWREVLTNFGVLMEVGIMVLLMIRGWTVVGVVEGVLYVMGDGRDACVGSGRVNERYCCRLPGVI